MNREIPMLNVVLIVTPRIKKTRPAIKPARPALICNKNHLTENKYTITLNPISRKQPILNLETSPVQRLIDVWFDLPMIRLFLGTEI